MIAIPAIDLRDGACVQLVGGKFDAERVRLDDPLAVAREWERFGFARLHVVDLDAALSVGNNRDSVEGIINATAIPTQVGGGLRTTTAVEEMFDLGPSQIIVGTRALEEPDWLSELAFTHPGRIIVAADVKERELVSRGWTSGIRRDVIDFLDEISNLPLAAVLVTAVHREGQLGGVDLRLMEDVVEAAAVPVYAAGGVASMTDLFQLSDRGVAGAVIGMALYTGALDPRTLALEFGNDD